MFFGCRWFNFVFLVLVGIVFFFVKGSCLLVCRCFNVLVICWFGFIVFFFGLLLGLIVILVSGIYLSRNNIFLIVFFFFIFVLWLERFYLVFCRIEIIIDGVLLLFLVILNIFYNRIWIILRLMLKNFIYLR